jgi:chromosome partitioning protein
MHHILVMNSKGGCGKSTLATNLAAYFAQEGYDTALADYDPLQTSLEWLKRRPEDRPHIDGVAGFEDGLRHLPRRADYLIMDAPARTHGKELGDLVRRADTIIVPVLPSPIDIRATTQFVDELQRSATMQKKGKAKVGVVANRVRENTRIFDQLDDYLDGIKRTRYVAVLREAQNYNRAYSRGLGIHELPEYLAWQDWDRWDPMLEWLWSKSSRP